MISLLFQKINRPITQTIFKNDDMKLFYSDDVDDVESKNQFIQFPVSPKHLPWVLFIFTSILLNWRRTFSTALDILDMNERAHPQLMRKRIGIKTIPFFLTWMGPKCTRTLIQIPLMCIDYEHWPFVRFYYHWLMRMLNNHHHAKFISTEDSKKTVALQINFHKQIQIRHRLVVPYTSAQWRHAHSLNLDGLAKNAKQIRSAISQPNRSLLIILLSYMSIYEYVRYVSFMARPNILNMLLPAPYTMYEMNATVAAGPLSIDQTTASATRPGAHTTHSSFACADATKNRWFFCELHAHRVIGC